jgi:uncharacterized protein YjlB
MDTKEMVISDEAMEMVKFISAKTCRTLDESIEEFVYLSEWKGRCLEETIKKHFHYHTEGHKEIAKMEMSPSLAALVGICGKVPDNYDWREDVAEELYKEYIK